LENLLPVKLFFQLHLMLIRYFGGVLRLIFSVPELVTLIPNWPSFAFLAEFFCYQLSHCSPQKVLRARDKRFCFQFNIHK